MSGQPSPATFSQKVQSRISAEMDALAQKVESGDFTDSDADERGWIAYREQPDSDGVRKEHRVPVQHWALYERHHNL